MVFLHTYLWRQKALYVNSDSCMHGQMKETSLTLVSELGGMSLGWERTMCVAPSISPGMSPEFSGRYLTTPTFGGRSAASEDTSVLQKQQQRWTYMLSVHTVLTTLTILPSYSSHRHTPMMLFPKNNTILCHNMHTSMYSFLTWLEWGYASSNYLPGLICILCFTDRVWGHEVSQILLAIVMRKRYGHVSVARVVPLLVVVIYFRAWALDQLYMGYLHYGEGKRKRERRDCLESLAIEH